MTGRNIPVATPLETALCGIGYSEEKPGFTKILKKFSHGKSFLRL